MKTLAMTIYYTTALISFFWSMAFIIDKVSLIGALVAVVIFPVTICLTPIYVGIATGKWALCAITCCGTILASILLALSKED